MKLINLRQVAGGQNLISQVNDLVKSLSDVNTRIGTLQKMVFPVKDPIDLTGLTASEVNFTLTNEPNKQPVELDINGLIYKEDDAFTVDRSTKKLTWTFSDASGGFDIDSYLSDKMIAIYYTGVLLENNASVRMLRMNELPTTGAYNVGDMIIKLKPTTGSNIGWICTKEGTPGEWIPVGITDFNNVIKVENDTTKD